MAYRKPQRYFSFADLAIEKHADKDWNPINALLSKFYDTGKSEEGGKAYPPLRVC
jgi:hypothetical protein